MKRFVSALLSLFMVMTLIAGTALAAPSSSDAAIKVGKTTISIGSKLSTLTKALGGDYTKEETPGCNTGAEYTYYWDNVMAKTTLRKGVAYITALEINGSGASTRAGIKVGSSESSVVSKYGKPSAVDGSEYVYKAGKSRKISITFDGDKVESIYIY